MIATIEAPRVAPHDQSARWWTVLHNPKLQQAGNSWSPLAPGYDTVAADAAAVSQSSPVAGQGCCPPLNFIVMLA